MFLSVEWAKRWLPAVFLLLSLLLPWSTYLEHRPVGWWTAYRSFLWADGIFPQITYEIVWIYEVQFSQLPHSFFISVLILTAGLCGLSSKSETRRLGGLFGILGIVSYLIFIFPNREGYKEIRFVLGTVNPKWHVNQFFGIAYYRGGRLWAIWFLSVGFFLALAGSLMLLLPLIRTVIEKLRKRLQSSKLQLCW